MNDFLMLILTWVLAGQLVAWLIGGASTMGQVNSR